MFENVQFIRLICVALLAVLTIYSISTVEKCTNHLEFPCWWNDIYSIGYFIFYGLLIYLYIQSINLSKCKIHTTIDVMFLSILIFVFLSAIGLWSLMDLQLSGVCIIMAAIIMAMLVVVCFHITKLLGAISLLLLSFILFQVALVFNTKTRRLNND